MDQSRPDCRCAGYASAYEQCRRRRAFDTIFKHLPYDPAGSFAFRWECVLRRLDQTDADALTAAIRGQIAALA